MIGRGEQSTGIFVSELNSTTVALAASATFTGGTEDIRKFQEVDINLAGAPSVAPGTLFFEFSPDGTNWDVSVPYTLTGPSIVPQFLRIVLPFFRVRYANGGTTLTQLRLTVSLHYQSAARLTRFLNQYIDNNEPVENTRAVIVGQKPDGTFSNVTLSPFSAFNVSIGDNSTGAISAVDPLGTIKVGEPTKLAGENFGATAPLASFWTITNANGGTSSPVVGELALQTNLTANGSTNIQSVKRSRFSAGSANVFQGSVRLGNTGVANNIRRWGAFNPGDAVGSQDGYFFQLSGATFGVGIRKGGVDTVVTSGSFNGAFPFMMDSSNHLYEIRYDDSVLQFFQDRLLIHSLVSSAVIPVNTINFRVGFENTNSGGLATNQTMFVRGGSIYRFGSAIGRQTFTNVTAAATVTLKSSPGSLKAVVVNDPAATGAMTLYDNTAASGTVIGVINLTAVAGTLSYDLDFDTGLTYVTTGSGFNITVVYE